MPEYVYIVMLQTATPGDDGVENVDVAFAACSTMERLLEMLHTDMFPKMSVVLRMLPLPGDAVEGEQTYELFVQGVAIGMVSKQPVRS